MGSLRNIRIKKSILCRLKNIRPEALKGTSRYVWRDVGYKYNAHSDDVGPLRSMILRCWNTGAFIWRPVFRAVSAAGGALYSEFAWR